MQKTKITLSDAKDKNLVRKVLVARCFRLCNEWVSYL